MRRIPLAALATLTFISAAPLPGQAVRGRLLDDASGAAVTGAAVRLLDADAVLHAAALADSTGAFELRAKSPGAYLLRVDRIGYASLTSAPFELESGRVAEVDLRLGPEAIALDAIRVTASAEDPVADVAGMDHRTVGGYHLTEERLAAFRPGSRHVGDLLRKANVPGLVIRDDVYATRGRLGLGRHLALCIQLGRSRSGGDQCRMVRVYLNDTLLPEPEFALMGLDAETIDRMVLLRPGEAGVLYGTGARDGVLLLYTRAHRR